MIGCDDAIGMAFVLDGGDAGYLEQKVNKVKKICPYSQFPVTHLHTKKASAIPGTAGILART